MRLSAKPVSFLPRVGYRSLSLPEVDLPGLGRDHLSGLRFPSLSPDYRTRALREREKINTRQAHGHKASPRRGNYVGPRALCTPVRARRAKFRLLYELLHVRNKAPLIR